VNDHSGVKKFLKIERQLHCASVGGFFIGSSDTHLRRRKLRHSVHFSRGRANPLARLGHLRLVSRSYGCCWHPSFPSELLQWARRCLGCYLKTLCLLQSVPVLETLALQPGHLESSLTLSAECIGGKEVPPWMPHHFGFCTHNTESCHRRKHPLQHAFVVSSKSVSGNMHWTLCLYIPQDVGRFNEQRGKQNTVMQVHISKKNVDARVGPCM
jgi:hypothetical protein